MNNQEEKKKGRELHQPVTPEGSLGLLALGAVGIKAWKEKRKEEPTNNKVKKNE